MLTSKGADVIPLIGEMSEGQKGLGKAVPFIRPKHSFRQKIKTTVRSFLFTGNIKLLGSYYKSFD